MATQLKLASIDLVEMDREQLNACVVTYREIEGRGDCETMYQPIVTYKGELVRWAGYVEDKETANSMVEDMVAYIDYLKEQC